MSRFQNEVKISLPTNYKAVLKCCLDEADIEPFQYSFTWKTMQVFK